MDIINLEDLKKSIQIVVGVIVENFNRETGYHYPNLNAEIEKLKGIHLLILTMDELTPIKKDLKILISRLEEKMVKFDIEGDFYTLTNLAYFEEVKE